MLTVTFVSEDNPYEARPCPVCHKSISNRANLKKHLKIRHSEQEEATCPHCHKPFRNKYSLWTHVNSYHPQAKVMPHHQQPQSQQYSAGKLLLLQPPQQHCSSSSCSSSSSSHPTDLSVPTSNPTTSSLLLDRSPSSSLVSCVPSSQQIDYTHYPTTPHGRLRTEDTASSVISPPSPPSTAYLGSSSSHDHLHGSRYSEEPRPYYHDSPSQAEYGGAAGSSDAEAIVPGSSECSHEQHI